ncbi:putative ribonuclease H protein [Senna tora]|uniref:Putative ribonuclease H protein n=1 Tax=Senna tora TaxID=362788 RepID=A0A834U079_9FABA|nr:putative ribonuclease H protein [Senna tora]
MPYYHMQHSRLPKGTINQIKKMERSFLWGSTPEKRRLHQVNWEKTCHPRSLGDLGIRKMESMNKHVDEDGQRNLLELAEALPEEITKRISESRTPYLNLGSDMPAWTPGQNGMFTVKSAYNALEGISKESGSVWDYVWKTKTQERNKYLLWRLGHDKLPTRNRIATWSKYSASCPRSKEDTVPSEPHRVILNQAKIHALAWNNSEENRGEWWEIFYGLKLAWDLGLRNVEVESDSSIAVNELDGKATNPKMLHPTLVSIREPLRKEWEIKIKYIPRAGNVCADMIAKNSLSCPMALLRINTIPQWIGEYVAKDAGHFCEPCDLGG